jgi:hypothetical protein
MAFCFNNQGYLSSELKDYLPCDESFGNDMKDWSVIQRTLLASSSNAVQLLFRAVLHIAKSGYCHNDIKWEHLALLPVYNNSSSLISLEPILVDLADVKQTNDGLSPMARYILENLLVGEQYESQRNEFEQLLADEKLVVTALGPIKATPN